MKKWLVEISVFALAVMFSAGMAAAAGGNSYYFQKAWGPGVTGFGASAVAADPFGSVYVENGTYGSMFKFDTNGNLLATWNSYYWGGAKYYYQGPFTVDSAGNIYLYDPQWGVGAIWKFDPNGNPLSVFGTPGSGPGQIYFYGAGLAVGASGDIYVADSRNYRVDVLDANGNYLAAWSGWIVNGVSESFYSIQGIAAGPSGNIYVSDSTGSGANLVVEFDPDGNYLAQWTVGCSGPLAADNIGNLFCENNGIYKYDGSNGNLLAVWNWGSEQNTAKWSYIPWHTGGQYLANTYDVTVDPSGNVYVAGELAYGNGSTSQDVSKWAPNGWITATALFNGAGIQNAVLYLQKDSQAGTPPDQKDMLRQMAGFISLDNATDANGNIVAAVPPGKWFVRILKRAGNASVWEPPYPGDYTWISTPPVTIQNNGVVNLGTVNTHIYVRQKLPTVSGILTGTSSGKPLSGWFVRASLQPCNTNWSARCGGVFYPAVNRTGADGSYTITLPAAGTYYVYACPGPYMTCVGAHRIYWEDYPGGFSTCGNWASGVYHEYENCPTTVSSGQQLINLNIQAAGY